MLFKKSTVSPERRRLRFLILKMSAALSMFWFGYWSMGWELIYWRKPLDQAFFASSWNWILFGLSLFFFFEIVFFERGHNKTAEKAIWPEVSKANVSISTAERPIVLVPESEFTRPSKSPLVVTVAQPGAGMSYSAGPLFPGQNKKPQSSKSRFHIGFLRQTKRIFSGFLLILYVLLAMVSFISGNLMFLMFLGTAYIIFDYLWKTRRTAKI